MLLAALPVFIKMSQSTVASLNVRPDAPFIAMETDMAKAESTKTEPIISETISKAVSEGRALITQGKTKVEAAMAIYRILKDHPQEIVVDAFVAGASLTQRGALTYWYNCRRKVASERPGSTKPPPPGSD
jgi:hypothetical protein